MFSRLVVALLLAAVLTVNGARYSRTVTYDGEIVVRCNKEGRGVAAFLQNDFVDVWQFRPDGTVDVRISKDRFDTLSSSPECTLLISDVEAYVRRVENVTTSPAAEWFDEYHDYDEIVAWYEALAENNPDIVKFFTPSNGVSYEGRNMPVVTITKAADDDNPKVIYSQCQIHAREWISGATCMYLANKLVEEKDTLDELLKSVKFIFVTFVNPDGYVYTWNRDRLWRKNRSKGTPCDGVDLNRNYNDHWNQGGSSSNPCSETYHGAAAESEPETQFTSRYFRNEKNIVGAIDWHSYSQLILRPYGWTREDCPDEIRLRVLGDEMAVLIRVVDDKTYVNQKAADLYVATGTASDWFYSDDANSDHEYRAAGITIELRDTGEYGFLLPPDQIIPTGEEIYPAFLKFAESLKDSPLEKRVTILNQ